MSTNTDLSGKVDKITVDLVENQAVTSTRLPKSIKRRLKALAKRENRTISNMIARIVVEYFKKD
jgi:predicted DNA-binding protein